MNEGKLVSLAALLQTPPSRVCLSNLSASWGDAERHRGLGKPSSDKTSEEVARMNQGGDLEGVVQNEALVGSRDGYRSHGKDDLRVGSVCQVIK